MARTETFIAPKSRVVIRQSNKTPQWYVTQKTVVVDPARMSEATCPMSGAPVATWVESGVTIYFPTNVLRTHLVLEDGDLNPAALNEQFSLFHYDVPKRGEYPNPSGRLYPIAVRLTESCWIVKTEDTLILPLMAEMLDAGCRVRINKFDKSESRALLADAIEELRKTIAEKVASANASVASADAQLDASDAEGLTEVAARKRYEARIRTVERSLATLTGDLAKAAERFGINKSAFNHSHLATVAKKSRESANEKARAYVHGAQHLAALGTTTGVALANAALTVGIPTNVMADALRDDGDDAAADKVQGAFDDGTFSLNDE